MELKKIFVFIRSFTCVSRSENLTLAVDAPERFHNLIYIDLIHRRFRCAANFTGCLSRIKRWAYPLEFLNFIPLFQKTFFPREHVNFISNSAKFISKSLGRASDIYFVHLRFPCASRCAARSINRAETLMAGPFDPCGNFGNLPS